MPIVFWIGLFFTGGVARRPRDKGFELEGVVLGLVKWISFQSSNLMKILDRTTRLKFLKIAKIYEIKLEIK